MVESENKDNQDARERLRSGAETLSQFSSVAEKLKFCVIKRKDISQEKDVVVFFLIK